MKNTHLTKEEEVVVLAHQDATAENTLEAPRKIAPVEQTMPISGPEFSHTFAAHSLTVLRIGTGR